jgi:8-oxo-dGTP pyrophosphatase MutT (NUDIX family)
MKQNRKSTTSMLAKDLKSSRSGNAGHDLQQAGAICYRRNESGRLRVLLVGSLRNGRWGVPKGHLDPGETSSVAALREAFEEAGVVGEIDPEVFGSFSYQKDSTPHRYHVAVHLLEVSGIATDFPEKTIRRQKWFPIEVAIRDVSQSGLRALLKRLR